MTTIAEPTYTDRGFAHWEPVEADREITVRIYESSSADPHVWMVVEDGLGHVPTAHLGLEAARAVRDTLDAAIKHTEDRFHGSAL